MIVAVGKISLQRLRMRLASEEMHSIMWIANEIGLGVGISESLWRPEGKIVQINLNNDHWYPLPRCKSEVLKILYILHF